MQRAIWFVAPMIALAMLIAPLATAADPSDYVAPDDAKAKIKTYYDDVYSTVVRRVYLLEIVRAPDDTEQGNISAQSASVYKATFHYSYLGGEWRIKEIKRYRGKIMFRYET
ncbi:MAG: hypothetical protein JRF63_01520 [Deltaproteobacteria bacterium]|nr:hypothetical protein [Deltaproteobacteria bacterium]